MTVNSSSSFDDSQLYPNGSSSSYALPLFMQCFLSRPSSFVFTAYTITKILLILPLSFFILIIALQRQRPVTSRHSDYFIYNMVIIELVFIVGGVLCCWSLYRVHLAILNLGYLIVSFSWYGQAIAHILISVEGYLATVHPITYMSLSKERRIRFRNAEILCNWLLAFAGMSLAMFNYSFIIMDFALLMLSFTVTVFCSLSVLGVLIRPRPGKQGGVRKRFDQLKRKALFSVIVTLEVLFLRFTWNLAWVAMFMSGNGNCLVLMCCTFSSLPSSLVSLLLFLCRERKFVCGSNNRK